LPKGRNTAHELLARNACRGLARGLPGCASQSANQVRMHACRFRADTCRELRARIDALLADP
jgi:LuxR family maltose regulon positive regulatory protein